MLRLFFLLPLLFYHICHAQNSELCDNALDDDQDGLIDLHDPDCMCDPALPLSPIPNPSFELQSCCPDEQGRMDCVNGWVQASEPTADYYHLCGWADYPSFQAQQPYPEGEGIIGFRNGQFEGAVNAPGWKEYIGACLNFPLKEQENYVFDLSVGFGDEWHSPPLELTIWGTDDCADLPFGMGDPEFGCPQKSRGWKLLDQISVEGELEWKQITFSFIPDRDIQAIVIGPDCTDTMAKPNPYYFLDDIILVESSYKEPDLQLTAHPCDDALSIRIGERDRYRYQWYKDGIALLDETEIDLSQMYGDGIYQVRMHDAQGRCYLSDTLSYEKPEIYKELQFAICENGSYLFGDDLLVDAGVYLDTFLNNEGCDSVVLLELKVREDVGDTIEAYIFPTESYQVGNNHYDMPGEYVNQLQAQSGCDSTIFLRLFWYELYAPTAFSPNDDGVNDVFSVLGGETVEQITRFQIFNRWGKLVYEISDLSSSKEVSWDGRISGSAAQEDVYVFVAAVIFDDGQERRSAGSFVLLR